MITYYQETQEQWKIQPLPKRLENRNIDAGDVSPAFIDSLNKYLSTNPNQLQGIQVDFDDGHCPTIENQLNSWKNIREIVQSRNLSLCPVMMLRPRALNMTDHLVNFQDLPMNGGLLDFAILMYQNGQALANSGQEVPGDNEDSTSAGSKQTADYHRKCNNNYQSRNGPFFYLSKLENAQEAQLWNDIFDWTETKLELIPGTIKACILIENIFAAFEMEAMLYNIKDHAIGLNCGMWDYSASILANFGHRPEFVLPDRHQYVNIQSKFMDVYYKKVIQICHLHGAKATGGMAAAIYDVKMIQKVLTSKRIEISKGVDGFLVYDLKFLPELNKMSKRLGIYDLRFVKELGNNDKKSRENGSAGKIDESDLLKIPHGKVTRRGLEKNIKVGILFIASWMIGQGTFILDGNVEDSATAEISRFQVWQWILHSIQLDLDDDEDHQQSNVVAVGTKIDLAMVKKISEQITETEVEHPQKKLGQDLFIELIQTKTQFITTWLNEHPVFHESSIQSVQ